MSAQWIGCAGWALRPQHASHFSEIGSHLERYASTFNAVEINSSFYRPHRRATYERWAASVPPLFRFSAKLPKEITHVRRLVDIEPLLDRFIDEVTGLGGKLGPILVQLPPKFECDAGVAARFVGKLRARFSGAVVWEPRHPTWFTDDVDRLFAEHSIARVAADPARVPEAAIPGGWRALAYFRLHGSPRIYYSKYTGEFISGIAAQIRDARNAGAQVWCIFDNTALGAATEDAMTLNAMLSDQPASKP